MRKCWKPISVLCALLAAAAGCSAGGGAGPESPLMKPGVSDSPLAPSAADIPMVNSSPGLGAVVGLMEPSVDMAPLLWEGRILLGGVVEDENGVAHYAYANADTALEAEWMPDNYFYFTDVAPGTYSVVYWTPWAMTPLVYYDQSTETEGAMVTVLAVADEQTYIGVVALP
jgi:hypothetical protein